MNKPLTLREALAQSTSKPRRATVCTDGVLYYVTLQADGTHQIFARSMGSESADACDVCAESLPESGWVPGADLRAPEMSPAYWKAPADGPGN